MVFTPHKWYKLPQVETLLEADSHVLGLYRLELPFEQHHTFPKMAARIANGQSIGTQNPEELARLDAYAGKVMWVEDPQPTDDPKYLSAHFVLAFPKNILMWDMGMLQTVCFGKISMGGRIRWVDVAVPQSVAKHLKGPARGAIGIRERCNVPNTEPLLMSIFKPCVGVPPEDLARMMTLMAEGGVHLVKDDEVLADETLKGMLVRVRACMDALDEAEEAGHTRPIYAVNLNGKAHELLDRAKALVDAGVEAILFNYLAYGLPMLNSLREVLGDAAILIGHPALGGAFYGNPATGMSPQLVFGTLPRLAGADAVLFPSPYGSVALSLADAQAVHHALNTIDLPVAPAFSVPSAGIQASMIPQILEDFGPECIINAGTGIHDVKGGTIAGIRAFQSSVILSVAEGSPKQETSKCTPSKTS